MVLDPTGVAALNIIGQTIINFSVCGAHHCKLFKTNVTLNYSIIYELSMVSNKMFYAIDQRLRQAFPKNGVAFFGACFVMLEDLGQLPPVGDSRLFMRNDKNEHILHGFATFRQFNTGYHHKKMC